MEEKHSLKSLLYKSFFKTILVPLIVIELTLLILYFSISNFLIENTQNSLKDEINRNLTTILEKEALFIQEQFKTVSDYADILRNKQEHIFQNKEKYLQTVKSPELLVASNGVTYNKNNGGSSIFYANTTKIKQKELNKIHLTETFDLDLKFVTDTNDLVVASYFNTYDNMIRIYPFIPNIHSLFPANMSLKEFNFYYEADKKHNPDKKTVWTQAYLDPAGKGWMLSSITPIYNGDFLEGVTGLDVTIEKFRKNILNLKIPWEGKAFLTSEDGLIFAMPKEVEDILKLENLNHIDSDDSYYLKPEELSIYRNPKLFELFHPLRSSNGGIETITIDSKEYILANITISLTNWKLYIIVDKDVVFQSVYELRETAHKYGIYAIMGMIVFYIMFFMFIYKKARQMSRDIAIPISKLANSSKGFSSDIKVTNLEDSNIIEIDTLSNNFNEMSQELNKKTTALEKLNETLEKRVENEVSKNRQKDQHIFQQARLAQMGEMISMIAHQWRQPLNAISATTNNMIFKLALDEYDKEFFEKQTNLVSEYSQQLSKTIDNFRDFFKENKEKTVTTLNNIVDLTLDVVSDSVEDKNIKIIKTFNTYENIYSYTNEIKHVLLNIIRNAESAIWENQIENGQIEILTMQKDDKLCIEVKDNGGGIPSDIIDKVFDPYFSTKETKEGAGLGLFTSKTIIDKHCEGKLEVKSIDKTTTFSISLPINKPDAIKKDS